MGYRRVRVWARRVSFGLGGLGFGAGAFPLNPEE